MNDHYGWAMPGLETVTSWLSDQGQALLADVGYSAGPEIYTSLDPRMVAKPASNEVAYEQAVYFLALAARRADFENEKEAQYALVEAKNQVLSQAAAVQDTWVCNWTGVWCLGGDASAVLSQSIASVKASGLAAGDRDKIVGYLSTNRNAVLFHRARPWLAAGTVAGLIWLWRRST